LNQDDPQGRNLNVAVIGAGAFGRNHLRVYRELAASGQPLNLAAVVDSDPAVVRQFGGEESPRFYSSLDDCIAALRAGNLHLDAASVCVPTSQHFSAASALLQQKVDVLLEKPIASSLGEAAALAGLARQTGAVLQIGHLERFNPAVLAALPLINRPMFFEAHRLSVFTPRSLDVDVVLDLMIHDLDIVLSMVRSPIQSVHAVGLPILSRKVDIANVRLEFESGCVANFTASRVSTERVRKLRFFQPRQYVSIDYARKDLLIIDVAAGSLSSIPTSGPLPAGLALNKPTVPEGEPLRLEIESFLDSVRTRTPPRVSAEDGCTALAAALEIHQAMTAHARRAGLDQFHL
jgi:predicted dehydrogenase